MPFVETWPDFRVKYLKELFEAGSSASVIAEKLSTPDAKITRNMVCGKIRRLGLVYSKRNPTPAEIQGRKDRRREKQNGYQRKRRSSSQSKPLPPRAEKRKMPDVSELTPLNLTLADLTFCDGRPVECRLITNKDLTNATYCGHPVDGESSWCAHHRMKLQRPKNWIDSKYVPKIACAA